ncbi:MAG: isoprenylcysteine carboxylmethyltransferase family protein [Sphingomonadales bacterium]|jgi:protein-S-isoprenylcysteine O-methyltransferase Ste14
MSKILILLYSVLCYLIFFVTFLYLIAFVENYPALQEFGFYNTIDSPVVSQSLGMAIAINLGLIALFGVQHSVMARKGFKRWWTKIVPPAAERSTFVLLTSAILILTFWQWRPIPDTVWAIQNDMLALAMVSLSMIGWLVVFVSTFLLGHFELFGLAQGWANMQGRVIKAPSMREPMFYKYMRHPLYFGFLLAFWAAPIMTLGHLIFALGYTVYILIAIRYEEKDLTEVFGAQYVEYKRRVSMLIPMPPKGHG